MALGPGFLKKLLITSSVVYLLFGLLLGSHGLNLVVINSTEQTTQIEVISVSLSRKGGDRLYPSLHCFFWIR